jgi:maltooligosyltrehalose synthase
MIEHNEEQSETLSDRVQARVQQARRVIDRGANAGDLEAKRLLLPANASSNQLSSDELREFQSLKQVFRDLGASYRRYRRQTGNRAMPGLRDAAYNFRAEPSLASLVTVAGFLDRLDLLS